MKVADESQALRLVIQTQQDGRRRSTSPLACGSDQKEEQDGRRRTPSPVACGSDQQHRRPSPVARGPDAGTTKGLITTWLPAAALDKI